MARPGRGYALTWGQRRRGCGLATEQDSRTSESDIPSWPSALLHGLLSAARRTFRRREDDVDGSIRTVAVAFLSNFVVMVAKYIGFLLSGSSALLAESVHSTAVTINQALLLRGTLTAMRPATRQHPFGFGRARYFWAFVVAVVIFGIGSVISIGRGILALGGEGETIAHPIIPFAGLTVGLVMDGSSFLVARRQMSEEKGRLSYWQFIRRSHNPEVPVVLLEDTAALIGLFFAYLGVGLAVVTGNSLYDALASIMIGILLAVVAFILAREMSSLLIGESGSPEQQERLEQLFGGHDDVESVRYVRTVYLGPGDMLVEAKAVFRDSLDFLGVARAIDEMEQAARDEVEDVRLVAIEPDVPESRDEEVPPYAADREDR